MTISLSLWFLLFMIYAFLGWGIEVVNLFFHTRRFINRGFLIGPYCPIYGFGALASIVLLYRYLDDPIALFIMSMVIFSILEYSTSWLMEKLFNARWWDYSDKKFNLNGRICLETMVPFGLGGLFTLYFLNPLLVDLLNQIPSSIITGLALILALIFAVDNIISFQLIFKLKTNLKHFAQDSTEEISAFVQNQLKKTSKLNTRLFNAFPQLDFHSALKKIRYQLNENLKSIRHKF